MSTNKPAAVAAVSSVVDPRLWTTELEAVAARISDRFARPETAQHALDLVAGLISDLERKNCWTIAERAGHPSPHGLQHLLARAVCDTDGVRDDLRRYVTDQLMTPGEQAVLVVDETGDLKKGTRTVGVQRQYTGTAGRVENARVAVYEEPDTAADLARTSLRWQRLSWPGCASWSTTGTRRSTTWQRST